MLDFLSNVLHRVPIDVFLSDRFSKTLPIFLVFENVLFFGLQYVHLSDF